MIICKVQDCIFNENETAECKIYPTINKEIQFDEEFQHSRLTDPKCLTYKRKVKK